MTERLENTRGRGRGWALAAGSVVSLAAGLSLFVSTAFAEKPTGAKKLNREIAIMERTIDDVLVESPNLLVSGRSVTEGVYVDGYGVIFTFSASLVPEGWRFGGFWDKHIEVHDDGDRIVVFRGDGDWDDDSEEADAPRAEKKERDKNRREKDKKSWFERREKNAEREEKLYERGKGELRDLLLDYGDMISGLSDDQWIVVAVHLDGAEYFHDAKLSQCVLKARVGDLRAFTAGSLSREAVLAKVTIDER